MRVALYLPDRLYGFCEPIDGGGQVFFHASVFRRIKDDEPPPILGEPVEVVVGTPTSENAPRALSVMRLQLPVFIGGTVCSFDVKQGWGFGTDFFLHRADILGGRIPLRGQRVRFFTGLKNARPRACYVEV